jgi:arthrofactin-type cyclic lipopeptide synthetase C
LIAGREYVPTPIPIPIHLFRAEETSNGDGADSHYNYWEMALPMEMIRLIPVPGTHLSMMEPPHVASLGEAISHAMSPTLAPTPALKNKTGYSTIRSGGM